VRCCVCRGDLYRRGTCSVREVSADHEHQFCRKHSSHFCPCVAPWLYGSAAKATYERDFERGRSTIHDEPAHAQNGFGQDEDDQLALAPEDGEIL
jgi:hypothetical protein